MTLLLRQLDSRGQATTIHEVPSTVKSLTADADTVYLSDPTNGQILVCEKSVEVFVQELPGVQGIQFVGDRLICSGDDYFFAIDMFDRSCIPLIGTHGKITLRSIKGDPNAELPRINGVYYLKHTGQLFFAYPERHRIYLLNPDSIISELLGNGKQGFSIGVGGCGSMNRPNDVAIHRGNLYVSDTGNHIIREFILRDSGNLIDNGRFIGHPMEEGGVDDEGNLARLSYPTDMEVSNESLYFVDQYRKIRSVFLRKLIVQTLYESSNTIEAIALGSGDSVFFLESSK